MQTVKSINYICDQQIYLFTSLYAISQFIIYVISQSIYLLTKQICNQSVNHKLVFNQSIQQLYTLISSILISEIDDKIIIHVEINQLFNDKISEQILLIIYV